MRSTPSAPASLTAEPDRFSDDAWDLLLAAQEQARRWRHGAMDVEHLLQALWLDRRFAAWVEPLPVDADRLLDRLEAFCADQPQSRGGELYIGDALEDLLEQADRCRAGWGDALLEVGHLLTALLAEPRIGADALAGEGLSEELLRRRRPTGAGAGPTPEPGRPAVEEADWIDAAPARPAPPRCAAHR